MCPTCTRPTTTRGLSCSRTWAARHLLAQLNAGGDADALYGDALDALARIQRAWRRRCCASCRPTTAPALEREMQLLPEWFCARHLGLEPDAGDATRCWRGPFDFLVGEALAQPVVFVHRDYHSRNLMVLPQRSPGIIDFQDALAGPVAYDLASLLKDCYVAWPRARVERWVRGLSARRLPRHRRCVDGVDDARVPALVRPDRPAAPPEGARHLRAPLVSRRQERLSRRPAADARVRARHRAALCRAAATSRAGVEAVLVPGAARRRMRARRGAWPRARVA